MAEVMVPPAAVAYRLLGPLEVIARGVPITLPKGNVAAVLAILLVRRNTVVSVDGITQALWGDDPPAAARSGVQVAVSSLRRAITAADLVDPVQTAPPGYRLVAPAGSTDLDDFVSHRTRARALLAGGDPAAASAHYRAALDTWTGEPLADLQHLRFAEEFAVAWEEERLTTLQERIDADLRAGRHELVIGELFGMTSRHPLRERLWAQLIAALYRAGRQAEALQAARSVRHVLLEELGIDPGPELQELERRVLRQERESWPAPAVAVAGPAGMETAIEAEEASRGILVDGDGRRYPVPRRGLRIGRAPDNDVILDGSRVSRHHAVVSDTGAEFVLSDLNSTNGTRVDGLRVLGMQPLSVGITVTIGGHVLQLQPNAPPDADVDHSDR